MDGTTALVIIIVILAVVALAAIWRYRKRIKIDLGAGGNGPKLTVDGSNEPAAQAPVPAAKPGSASIKDVEAGKDIRAKTTTGGDASVEGSKAKGSITATTENPPNPKA